MSAELQAAVDAFLGRCQHCPFRDGLDLQCLPVHAGGNCDR